jgi:hypothetical protein
LGPVQLVAAAWRGQVIGLSSLLLAISAGWIFYHLVKSKMGAHQLAAAAGTLFGLGFGYLAATIIASVVMAVSVPSDMKSSACIVRQPLLQMIATDNYQQRDKPAHAMMWAGDGFYNWSFDKHRWDKNDWLFPKPYQGSKPARCIPLPLQTL